MKNLGVLWAWTMVFVVASSMVSPSASAADRSKLDSDARAALTKLVANNAGAKALSAKAHAVLVFPSITKAGLVVGGQSGDGVLMKGGRTVAYYNTSGASYGLQAGVQKFGYAMFFMNERALQQLDKADGFEVGVGPSVVVADEGFGKSATTMNYDKDIYAFVFNQRGLMAGLGIQGNKITRLTK